MLDARLRPTKQLVLAPITAHLGSLSPQAVTAASVIVGLAAAVAAALALWWLALILFLLNRLMDGLDGELARSSSLSSDAGGYADIVGDTVVYAAIPIGAAIGSSIDHIWIVTALLLASFYVNTITWSYLSAVIEKRGGSRISTPASLGASPGDTSVVMPAGLVEGFETMVFFVVMLTVPRWLDWTMGVMALAVVLGAAARFITGRRRLLADRSADHDVDRDMTGRSL